MHCFAVNLSSGDMPNVPEDILEIIPDDEIHKTCTMVAQELPISYYTYGFITTCYERRKADPAYDVSFYRHRYNGRSGTLICVLRTGNKTLGLLPYACEGFENYLEEALLNTSRINWSERPLIQGILPRHYEIINSVLTTKNFEAVLYVDSTIQVLSRENAFNFKIDIPDDTIYVRPLVIDDILSIYDLWTHKDVWTVDELVYAIRHDLSYGVFSKDTKDIQAWIMFPHYGGLGMLHTKEDCRRSGYAKLLVMLMSKELAKNNVTPFASIAASNFKSLSLFKSLGYEKATDIKIITPREKQNK